MKQCPLCHRSYADDLNFCLEDGKGLQAYPIENTLVDDAATVRYPRPDPVVRPPEPGPTVPFSQPLDRTMPVPPPPVPNSPLPQASTPVKRWTLLGVIGTIVIVLLWAAFKLAVRSMDNGERSAQSDSPVVVANPSPSSGPSIDSPCGTGDCDSPTPTPQLSPTPLPSPSPSPTPSATQELESQVQPGIYQGSFKPNNKAEDELGMRTIKLRFTLSSDGTYFIQGYLTIEMTDWRDKLYSEEKGNYSQAKDQLIFTNRLQRNLNLDTDEWSPWQVPNSGGVARDQLRNQTTMSFQLYVANNWMTLSKL